MLIVLADDFSGAAEIGGIGIRYGLSTELQLEIDLNSAADLIVVDTDTRSLLEPDAIRKMESVCDALKNSKGPIKIFKKVDSVMRGHLMTEINVVQRRFNFNRVLLLPANPGRGRKIVAGYYTVNGTSLDETVFASDPDFPISSSSVELLVNSKASNLRHVHLEVDQALPNLSLITGEIESKSDLKRYLTNTNELDLCCGAAELFESYLENLGYAPQTKKPISKQAVLPSFGLIINGSTVKHQAEKELYQKLNIPQLFFPGKLNVDEFKLEKAEETAWYQKILNTMYAHHVVVISIEHPVKRNKSLSEIFLTRFIEMMQYITSNIPMDDIHFCITGGATASFIIRNFASNKLKVKDEIVSGVVKLSMKNKYGGKQVFCIVKPGSYVWPESLLESLSTHHRK